MRQWYCHIGGRQYGPVGDADLRRWAADGRLAVADKVWTAGMSAWAPAGEVGGLFARERLGGVSVGETLSPHRGPLVLTFGLVSIAGILGIGCVCFIVCSAGGIVAIVLGAIDLKAMDAGRRDPSGRGMVLTWLILGAVGILFGIASVVLMVLGIAFASVIP